MSSTYYITGHRGAGKSTAGRLAGERLGWPVVDLDEVIEEGEGATCAEIIAGSEERFRALERDYRRRVVDEGGDGPQIVVLGGGYHPVPDDGVVVWLDRDGWEESAREGRERLKDEGDFGTEVDWMVATREPVWERSAHVKIEVPRARGPERVARDLATHLEWLEAMAESPLTRRSWVVAAEAGQVEAAARQAGLLGLAGVEVRSDLMGAEAALEVEAPILASLRTPGMEWLRSVGGRAEGIDIDLAYLEKMLEAGLLGEMSPRPLLLSAHPDGVASAHVERFAEAGEAVAAAHPDWADELVVKYAPRIADYDELHRALDLKDELRERFERVTFLPQGDRYAWTRPPLAADNATNYVPVGLAPHRRGHTDNPVQTPLDLQAWLPHLAGPVPRRFEGLLGDPVRGSQGDVWHRRAAEGATSYLKIPAPSDLDDAEFARLFDAIERLPIRGLSVTAPHKKRVPTLDRVVNPEGLEAVNTLARRADDSWLACDTDAAGMAASLAAAEEAGFGPGSVAIIGTGGVAPALRRAIAASDWELASHVRGRDGWSAAEVDRVDLVVNAVGDRAAAYDGAPDCDVWLDLHYRDVQPQSDRVELHLNGDRFFDGQAAEQRDFWERNDHFAAETQRRRGKTKRRKY